MESKCGVSGLKLGFIYGTIRKKKKAFSVCQRTEYYVMLAANIKQMSVLIKMLSNTSALQDHYK